MRVSYEYKNLIHARVYSFFLSSYFHFLYSLSREFFPDWAELAA